MSKTIIVVTNQNWQLLGPSSNNHQAFWLSELPEAVRRFKELSFNKRVLLPSGALESFLDLAATTHDCELGILNFEEGATNTDVRGFENIEEAIDWAEVIVTGSQEISAALDCPESSSVFRMWAEVEVDRNEQFPELFEPEWKLLAAEQVQETKGRKLLLTCERYEWNLKTRSDIEVVPYPNRIVDPRGARSRKYLRWLMEVQRIGRCPFCEGGRTLVEDQILEINDECWIKMSLTPQGNSLAHFVVAPLRHRSSLEELTAREQTEMRKLLKKHVEHQGLKLANCMTFTRSGPTEATGATICHVHENVVFPSQRSDGSYKLIQVNCGHSEDAPDWLSK